MIPRDLAVRLAKMAGFRNLLVYGYAKVDDSRMLRTMREDLGDIDAHLDCIEEYLLGIGAIPGRTTPRVTNVTGEPTPLEFQFAASRGIVFFSRDEAARLEFVERTWLRYFDFEPVLRENLRDFLEA